VGWLERQVRGGRFVRRNPLFDFAGAVGCKRNGKRRLHIISIGNSSERVHAMRAGTVQGAIVSQPEDLVLLESGFMILGSVGEHLKDIQLFLTLAGPFVRERLVVASDA
jgi:hypothetical protein